MFDGLEAITSLKSLKKLFLDMTYSKIILYIKYFNILIYIFF